MSSQSGPLAELIRRVAVIERQMAAQRPSGHRAPNQFALGRVVRRLDPDPDEIGEGLAVSVDFWEVVPLDFAQVDGQPPDVIERQVTPIRARVGNRSVIRPDELVGLALGTDGRWWIIARLASSPGRPPDACCDCPPTDCNHDIFSEHPQYMIVDFGELACCSGRAGGVHFLRWNGEAWSTEQFYCDPVGDEESGSACGSVTYVWRDPANTCAGATAVYVWTPGSPPFCLGGSWAVQTPCPDGCTSQQPPPPSIFNGDDPCDTIYREVTCYGGGETPTAGWELQSSNCSCGPIPPPPETSGTTDGETVTIACEATDPGTDPDCEPPPGSDIVYEGDDWDVVSPYVGLPGYVIWGLRLTSCLNYQYIYGDNSNHCEVPESAWDTRPGVPDHINAVDWAHFSIQPDLPRYVVKRCPAEDCPGTGKVRMRWTLTPPTGYEPARLELRQIGFGVRIRYEMAPGLTFCETCLNRMQVKSLAECEWPCENIPELVCVRPSMTKEGAVTCAPYARAYSFTCPTVDSDDSIYAADQGAGTGLEPSTDLARAAGSFVLDLKGNAGADADLSLNGCGRFDIACCTWIAPDVGATDTALGDCSHLGQLRWAMQTCSIRNQRGDVAYKFYQMYDCADDHVPVLRYGSSAYPSVTMADDRVLIGPALIRWSEFGGPSFSNTGLWDPVDNGCGVFTPNGGCCVTEDACGPLALDPVTNTNVWQKSFVFEWTMVERRDDGVLVMRNLDGWAVTKGFPEEILLTPQD